MKFLGFGIGWMLYVLDCGFFVEVFENESGFVVWIFFGIKSWEAFFLLNGMVLVVIGCLMLVCFVLRSVCCICLGSDFSCFFLFVLGIFEKIFFVSIVFFGEVKKNVLGL